MARRCNHHRGPRFPETHSSESRYRGDMFGHGQPHGKLQAQVSQGFSLHFHFLPLSTLAGLGGDLPLGIWPASAAACSHSDAARAHKEEAAGITVRARWCTTGPPDPLEEKLSPRRAQPPLLLLSTFTRKIHIQGSAPSPLSSRSWMEVQLLTTTLGGAGQWTPIGDPPNKAIPWLDAGRGAAAPGPSAPGPAGWLPGGEPRVAGQRGEDNLEHEGWRAGQGAWCPVCVCGAARR
ncbi:uncharacterized protein LOC118157515 isoform X2 [Oxyura jamaicensis]|uniref:uncharacterized protein LOC118157506 isoform X2 n=1 Tax=Oxyura jamaicensis TaxID=8884 RepID=UPI0015A68937|nr:uncharacterized protein LOC118157506 isoform X2 [Oxyura jamaicensis]XP_035167776.1 uncharacterized protein LOC118157515 isoform X2 [Oxyura jamaicensis]